MHLASKNYDIGYEFVIDEYIFREFTPLQNVGMYNMMESMSAKIGFFTVFRSNFCTQLLKPSFLHVLITAVRCGLDFL